MKTTEISDGRVRVTVAGGPFRFRVAHSGYPGVTARVNFPSRDWWMVLIGRAVWRTGDALTNWAHR